MPIGSARAGILGGGIAIPDSAVAWYDAQADSQPTGTISTISDQSGTFDLSGSATLVNSGINGNPSYQFDGVDDALNNSNPSETQPNTVFAVIELLDNDTTRDQAYFAGSDASNEHLLRQGTSDPGAQSIRAGGDDIKGNNSQTGVPTLVTGIFDGANSVLREDGAQTASGNAGTDLLSGITLGNTGIVDIPYEGYIGEILVCNDRLSATEIESEEQRLSAKWGITI